jgi:hypothetical protein
MDYLEIANSPTLYMIAAVILVFVLVQAAIFYRLAVQRAKVLNIPLEKIRKVRRAATIATIVPSLAVVIGLIAIAPSLGIPISWARLAMAGSLIYEIIVATIGGQVMGAESLGGAGYTAQAFANSVWLMTLGVLPSYFLVIFFLKRYKAEIQKRAATDQTWQGIFATTIFISVFAALAIPYTLKGGDELTATVVAALSMLILALIIAKLKQNWLKEYALSFSMIAAITAVILSHT